MLERKHKDIYVPLKTISLSDKNISRFYVLSWYKHNFVFCVKEKQLDGARSFELVTALN